MSGRVLELLDRATLVAMAVGVVVLLQPWWAGGLRAGFWVVLVATLAQIVVSHLPRPAALEHREAAG